jgi:hypothetical protein
MAKYISLIGPKRNVRDISVRISKRNMTLR